MYLHRAIIFSAIHLCIVSLFRDVILVDMPIVNLTDTICKKKNSQTKNNKSIRSLFLKEVATKPCSIAYRSKFVRSGKVFVITSYVFLLQTR